MGSLHEQERSGTAPRTVVIGGGFAGLAAATALVDRGHQAIVLERRPFVGGKVFSFDDRLSGHAVDNGQHAFLSAYRNTLALLGRWGTRHLVEFQRRLELRFMTPAGRVFPFKAQGLPAPLHLLGALAGFGALSWRDRLGMAVPALQLLALDAAGRQGLDDQSFGDWLRRHGQSDHAVRTFWEPLALAALNGPPDAISAYMASQILALGLLGDEASSRLGFATCALAELFAPAAAYLQARGGDLRLGSEARQIRPGKTSRWEVLLRGGSTLEADFVVAAVPPWRLKGIFPTELTARPDGLDLDAISSSPIVSIQLTFDRPLMPYDAVALLDSPVHWVFSTGRIRRDAPPGAVGLTTSFGHTFADLPQHEVRKIALAELARFFPTVREASVLACRVVKELDATVACIPGHDSLRPSAHTGLAGLYLAGAWTRTGLPGTIEGATMSGLNAASAIEQERGLPCDLVQPLPEPSGLAALPRHLFARASRP